MSVVLQTGVMYYRESQSDDWHPLILKVDTDLSALIEDYSQKAWALGEYCRYDSAIYRCTTAITTPEVWDSTHWQETTIGEELKNITDITGDGDLDSGFTASDLTGAANELLDITGDGSLTGFTATDLTGAANELKNTLNTEITTRGNEFNNRVYNNTMKSAPSNANDVTLIGSTFAQDTACSNLPTSSGNYYFLMFFGQAQFAILYNYQGAKRTYCRYYTNGNWYPWMPIEGKPETGTPTFPSGISGTVRLEKSGGVVIINGQITSTSTVAGNNGVLMTLPADFWPTETRYGRKTYLTYGSTTGFFDLVVGTTGNVFTNIGSNTIPANTPIQFVSMSYII